MAWPTRRQTIVWTNDGLITDAYIRHLASMSQSDLDNKFWHLHKSIIRASFLPWAMVHLVMNGMRKYWYHLGVAILLLTFLFPFQGNSFFYFFYLIFNFFFFFFFFFFGGGGGGGVMSELYYMFQNFSFPLADTLLQFVFLFQYHGLVKW